MSLNSALDVQSIASLAQQQQDEQNANNNGGKTNGNKRKAEDQGGQQRARRNRYVSIAWYVPSLAAALSRTRYDRISCDWTK